jgi:hypothetical protein
VRSNVLRKEKNKPDENEGKKFKEKHKKMNPSQSKEKEIKVIKQKSVYKERIRNESNRKSE